MSRLTPLSVILVAICGLSATATAQMKKDGDKSSVVTSKAAKARGDAADENIKNPNEKNDPKNKAEAPPEKGGPKTRGSACGLHVDNRTRWIIKVFVDGNYRGAVSPYGDVGGVVSSGWPTTLYGRAEFDDGSVLTWGPKTFNCETAQTYTWTISD